MFQLYQRSIEKRKLRCIPFIGDGDSLSYNHICIEKPYGGNTVYSESRLHCACDEKNGNKSKITLP